MTSPDLSGPVFTRGHRQSSSKSVNLCDDVVGVNKKNKLDDRDMGNQGIADLLEDYVPLTKVCVCVSVCVCLIERERERERARERERFCMG